MANPAQDPLADALKALETPLADAGFSLRVQQQLGPRLSLCPVDLSRPRWPLWLAALAGVLVTLATLWGADGGLSALKDLPGMLQFTDLTLNGLNQTGTRLALAAGWSLTLATCGWTLWQFR